MFATVFDKTGLFEELRRLVRHENKEELATIAARSYAHRNGFDKIVLDVQPTGMLRLHIWWPSRILPSDEHIHNHSANYVSVVLCGAIEERRYHSSPVSGEANGVHFWYRYAFPQPSIQKEFAMILQQDRRRLTMKERLTHRAGDVYSLEHCIPHTIRADRGQLTATLLRQGPQRVTWVDIYSLEEITADPTPIYFTPEQLRIRFDAFFSTT